MRKQSLFKAAEKHQGKLQSLGGVQAHQRDLRTLVIIVGVCNERSMVQELVERFPAVARISSGVDQFAQVFDARESFRRILLFEQLDVAGAIDQELEQVGGRSASIWLARQSIEAASSCKTAGGTPALLSAAFSPPA